jgi:hypothetical protein
LCHQCPRTAQRAYADKQARKKQRPHLDRHGRTPMSVAATLRVSHALSDSKKCAKPSRCAIGYCSTFSACSPIAIKRRPGAQRHAFLCPFGGLEFAMAQIFPARPFDEAHVSRASTSGIPEVLQRRCRMPE